MEWIESIATVRSQTYITKGDFDEFPNLPKNRVFAIGTYKFGVVHGNQVVPYGDIEALATLQRQLDCDILVSGNTHQLSISQYDGKYFINPGSLTGAFSLINSAPRPSFVLLNI